jgi:WD40 repeat protein
VGRPPATRAGPRLLLAAVAVFLVLARGSASAAGQAELTVQLGHASGVYDVAWAPGDQQIATIGFDRTVRLWDTATGAELRSLGLPGSGKPAQMSSVVFLPSGELAAIGGPDGGLTIWSLTTGAVERQLSLPLGQTTTIAASSRGRFVAMGDDEGQLGLYSLADEESRVCDTGLERVEVVSFLPRADGLVLALDRSGEARTIGPDCSVLGRSPPVAHRLLAARADADGTSMMFRTEEGRVEVRLMGVDEPLLTFSPREVPGTQTLLGAAAALSPQAGLVAFGEGPYVQIDGGGREALPAWHGQDGLVTGLAFSTGGSRLAIASTDGTVSVVDSDGREELVLRGDTVPIFAADLAGDTLALGTAVGEVSLWSPETGRETSRFVAHDGPVYDLVFLPDGETFVTGGRDGAIRVWRTPGGAPVRTIEGHDKAVMDLAVTADGTLLASGSLDGTVKVWELASGELLHRIVIQGHLAQVLAVDISPSGERVALASSGMDRVNVADLDRFEPTAEPAPAWGDYSALVVDFGPAGETLLVGGYAPEAELINLGQGGSVGRHVHEGPVVSAGAIDDQGGRVVTAAWGGAVEVWNAREGTATRHLAGHGGVVRAVGFAGSSVWSAGDDGTWRLWDPSTGAERVRVSVFRDGGWAVADSDGRYDAGRLGSDSGLHWVVGLEPIELSQLGERFFLPGLLGATLAGGALPEVPGLEGAKLFPEVDLDFAPGEPELLRIHLRDRGGGIGPVELYLNEKMVTSDLRGGDWDPEASEATLTFDLSTSSSFDPGWSNTVRVVPWNREKYFAGRGARRALSAPEGAEPAAPRFLGIVCGVSDYAGDAIDLQFGSTDAQAVAEALGRGGRSLFGHERAEVVLLADGPDERALPPTRDNIEAAFRKAGDLGPADVLVVYLAGHGAVLEGTASDYLYLSSDARTADADALRDPAVRSRTAVSGREFADWLSTVSARKQVLVLDTCGAGAVRQTLMEGRGLDGDQVRAIARLQRRTGLHILMGSAADRVSYEATRYGQGLLTYALIEGMRGAALREGGYADVSRLFEYASDRVPELARDIGGIQRPEVASAGGGSFDIARFSTEDRAALPLTGARPLVLRPSVGDRRSGLDPVGLKPLIREAVREQLRGSASPGVLIDSDDMPGAWQPVIRYRVTGARLVATVTMGLDDQSLARIRMAGRADRPEDLAARIGRWIRDEIARGSRRGPPPSLPEHLPGGEQGE